MYKCLFILFYLFIVSCDEDDTKEGCMDEFACNYNTEATEEDGSCLYPNSGFDCEGLCILEEDCLGECGGYALEDACGTCDDNPDNDCTQDCNGDFGGTAQLDDCGVCGGDSSSCDEGCGPNQPGPSGCDNTCGSTLEFDDCGVCDGDDSSCSGCTDSTACNYDDTATLDDGTCIPPNECSLCEECDLSAGTIYLTNDSELWYNVTETINGFQFDIYGVTITGISDGDAQNSGFEVTYTNGSTFSRVLGYSTSGSSVAPGCGTLLNISFEGTVTTVSDILFATTFGEPMNIDYTVCP